MSAINFEKLDVVFERVVSVEQMFTTNVVNAPNYWASEDRTLYINSQHILPPVMLVFGNKTALRVTPESQRADLTNVRWVNIYTISHKPDSDDFTIRVHDTTGKEEKFYTIEVTIADQVTVDMRQSSAAAKRRRHATHAVNLQTRLRDAAREHKMTVDDIQSEMRELSLNVAVPEINRAIFRHCAEHAHESGNDAAEKTMAFGTCLVETAEAATALQASERVLRNRLGDPDLQQKAFVMLLKAQAAKDKDEFMAAVRDVLDGGEVDAELKKFVRADEANDGAGSSGEEEDAAAS